MKLWYCGDGQRTKMTNVGAETSTVSFKLQGDDGNELLYPGYSILLISMIYRAEIIDIKIAHTANSDRH